MSIVGFLLFLVMLLASIKVFSLCIPKTARPTKVEGLGHASLALSEATVLMEIS